jgi:hypothetical protein
MFNNIIKIIHTLRIFFFFLIFFTFLFILGLSPVDVGRYIGAQFGAAIDESKAPNISATIPVNPINALALQLREKESKLTDREKGIDQRESDLVRAASLQSRLMWILTIGIIILFVLIIVNYIMDYQRRKLEKAGNSKK